jgi:4'-phosphopantetheinyl transferase
MIRLRLFDEMSLCTDAEVERMLPLVPDSRREQALRFRHTFGRFACLKSYLMLEQLLRDEFGISNPRISVSEHGKPYLADYPNIHFNISHCLKAVAVVVADIPVGIDVESFRDYSDGLLDKTMNETERQ